MQIRRDGLNFKLLRKVVDVDGRIRHTLLGYVAVECQSIKMVDAEVLDELTLKEVSQLAKYINRYQAKKILAKENKTSANVFQLLSEVNLELMEHVEYKNIENNREAYKKTCEILVKKMCDAGYAPDVLESVLGVVSESIKGNELEPEQARVMIHSWLRVRSVLNKQGFSSKWYNIFRNRSVPD